MSPVSRSLETAPVRGIRPPPKAELTEAQIPYLVHRSGGHGEYFEKTYTSFWKSDTYTFQLDWQSSNHNAQSADPGQGVSAEGPDFDYHFVVEPLSDDIVFLTDSWNSETLIVETAKPLLDPEDINPDDDSGSSFWIGLKDRDGAQDGDFTWVQCGLRWRQKKDVKKGTVPFAYLETGTSYKSIGLEPQFSRSRSTTGRTRTSNTRSSSATDSPN